MVDVGAKEVSRRRAVARATLTVKPETATRLRELPKGDAVAAAQIAGIMAAKRTSELDTALPSLAAHARRRLPGSRRRRLSRSLASAETTAQTGVEMEALVGATRRCADRLRHGEGDRRLDGRHRRATAGEDEGARVKAAVLTVSDGVDMGTREDKSGDALDGVARRRGVRGRPAESSPTSERRSPRRSRSSRARTESC